MVDLFLIFFIFCTRLAIRNECQVLYNEYTSDRHKVYSRRGTQKSEILNKEIDVFTLGDLLRWYPYRYVDRSRIYYVHEIDNSVAFIQLKGRITAFETFGEGRRRRLVAHFTDGTGFVDLVWFQGIRFIESKYKLNTEYIVFGKPSLFNGRWNIAHPDIDPFMDDSARPEG